MGSSLPERLSEIRRRLWQALFTHGLSWLTLTLVGLLLVVCLADWFLHFDDAGVRLILGLAVLGVCGWIGWRRLVRPLSVSFTDVDLALRIEDRFPRFRDSLASSVEFLMAESDPRFGSLSLQRAVIQDTLTQLEAVNTRDVIDTRESKRVATVALAVCLLAAVVGGLDRHQTSIALQRLLFPFSGPAWPRQTNLRLLRSDFTPLDPASPWRVARGESVKLFAENESGKIPDDVVLEWQVDGKITRDPMRPLVINEAQGNGRELAVGQLPTTRGDLEFRAAGGDDDEMPWQRLEVIPPPIVETLQATLILPRYLGGTIEPQPEGVGHVQAVVGTTVEISATVSKPLKSATVRLKDQQRLPVGITDDRQMISARFLILEPGIYSWWFDLADEQGFENADPPRYEVRGLQDAEPEVHIDQPVSDAFVTPYAVVPVRTVAKDDLGLKEVRLVYLREDPPGREPPAEGQELPPESGMIPLLEGAERPVENTSDYSWRIADLGVVEGSRIVFRAEATDDFDLSDVFTEGEPPPPHVGRSVMRTLTVVSQSEKAEELAQRQTKLLDDLERAFKLQKQARDQVGELQLQLRNTGKLRPEDRDSLQRTEIGQREVAAQLTHPLQGLRKRAADLLEEQRDNAVDDPASERRLSGLASELSRLEAENFPVIEQELTQARKLTQAQSERATENSKKSPTPSESKPATPRDATEQSLRDVADNQQEVLESLGEILRELSQWRSEQDAARELADLTKQQGELNRQTSELGQKTLTQKREELPAQEQADLDKLAERQKKQAEQLEQLQSQIEERIEALSRDNPGAAAALQEALDQAREQGLAEQMRDAAGQVSENRMGEASKSQDDVLRKLEELEKTLSNTRETDSDVLVKKLQQAEQELDQLQKRQLNLLERQQAAQQIADPQERAAELERLRVEQQQLREETARMARKLERLEAHRAAAAAQRSAARMQQAEQEAEAGDSEGAAQEQQESLDDLEQAQRELARDRREAQERLAREQLEKIAQELFAMVERQKGVIDETVRLDELRRGGGRLSRAQLASLRDLATTERTLKEETDRLVEKLSAAEVFALALKGASRHMQRAVDLLAERDTGAATQAAERAAHRRYVELIASLMPDKKEGGQGGPQGNQGGNAGGGEGPETDGIPTISQLKMLLSLQREVWERTIEIEKLRGASGKLGPAHQQELDALAQEQSEIADLTRNLSELASEPDDPESEEGPPEESPPEKPPTEQKPPPDVLPE